MAATGLRLIIKGHSSMGEWSGVWALPLFGGMVLNAAHMQRQLEGLEWFEYRTSKCFLIATHLYPPPMLLYFKTHLLPPAPHDKLLRGPNQVVIFIRAGTPVKSKNVV